MILIYCIIATLMLSTAGLTIILIDLRKKSRARYQKQQQTITALKMEAIRNRMSPHFTFNTLSGLSASANDPDKISQKIKSIQTLLRKSAENIEQVAISASEELELVKGYIDLQGSRLPEPFKVFFTIEEGTTMNQLIPAMIIQIPVENAIKHGLMPLTGEKLLSVKICNYDKGLHITVADNGIGYGSSPNRSTGAGTGLKILYQLIFLLNSKNSEKITFTIKNLAETDKSLWGTVVEIHVPANYSYKFMTDNE